MWDMMVKKMPGGMPKMGVGGAPKMGFGGAPKMGFGGMDKGALLGAVQAAPVMQSELKGAMPNAVPASPMMQSEFAAPRAALAQGPISEEMLASRYGSPMKSASSWGALLSKR